MDKIFEPFLTAKWKGTGLELTAVYRIVEDHSGTIRVESWEGRDTVVETRMPF